MAGKMCETGENGWWIGISRILQPSRSLENEHFFGDFLFRVWARHTKGAKSAMHPIRAGCKNKVVSDLWYQRQKLLFFTFPWPPPALASYVLTWGFWKEAPAKNRSVSISAPQTRNFRPYVVFPREAAAQYAVNMMLTGLLCTQRVKICK